MPTGVGRRGRGVYVYVAVGTSMAAADAPLDIHSLGDRGAMDSLSTIALMKVRMGSSRIIPACMLQGREAHGMLSADQGGSMRRLQKTDQQFADEGRGERMNRKQSVQQQRDRVCS